MFQRFAADARTIATDATEIARDLGAPMVEAEHLLLAATRLDAPAAQALHAAGLDYDGLLDALGAETARSLAAVGVTASTPAFSPFVRAPRFAASAKLALERSLKVALARKDTSIGVEHVVAAILQAPTGTVPRALECAGVDRVELAARLA